MAVEDIAITRTIGAFRAHPIDNAQLAALMDLISPTSLRAYDLV